MRLEVKLGLGLEIWLRLGLGPRRCVLGLDLRSGLGLGLELTWGLGWG